MYMRKWCFIQGVLLLLTILLASPASAAGTELMSVFSLRITVVEQGTEYEWEYDSPNKYEYEQGERVIKGDLAKDKMEHILEVLQFDENENVSSFVERLKQSDYPNLERVDIRYMDSDSRLHTWVWNKDR
ncbi:hypothetical protein JCM9157_1174 [Halalkalibacter akibai JCM 9157]|uniref:Uncharacterized protein n=2 Tax=Halalkalibacter akibai TaxID=1411 RepID=W4QR57_HALA3|nr:hypothetical protein JCM9157_1174 [Halalkalibacter akibai JCM 9157]